METTIHVFKFANMAKSSIHMLTSRCSQMFMEIGFLIEGRGNPQLPECLIGCASVNKPSEEKVGYLFNDWYGNGCEVAADSIEWNIYHSKYVFVPYCESLSLL